MYKLKKGASLVEIFTMIKLLIGCFPLRSFLGRFTLLFLFPVWVAPLSTITGLISSSLPPQTDGGRYAAGWEEEDEPDEEEE